MGKQLSLALTGYKLAAVASGILICLEVLAEIFVPFLMAQIIDVGIAERNLAYIYERGLYMLVLAALAFACGALAARLSAVAMAGFGHGLRRMLFEKIQSLSQANVEAFTTASLITRMTTDISSAQRALQAILRMLMRSPMMLIAATLMTIRIDADLSMLFAVAMPLLAIALAIVSVKAFPWFKLMLKRLDHMNAAVQENLAGLRAVKAFVKENSELQRFTDSAEAVRFSQVTAESIVAWEGPATSFIFYATVVAAYALGGRYVVSGQMHTGELIGFVSYIGQIIISLNIVSFALIILIFSQASIDRILEVLGDKPRIVDSAPTPLQPTSGDLEFHKVSFSYDPRAEKPSLENISFKLPAGSSLGILGATGSGKTSLIQLIPRFYDINDGELLLDNQPVDRYPLASLRQAVAIVPQKNVLFSGSVLDNLHWGQENATLEQCQEALKNAQAYEFVSAMPEGLESHVEQGGVNFSGGQRQRLCIARALIKNPKILILDDSTSALDMDTEERLMTALGEHYPQMSKIIITQKVSCLKHVNCVALMEDGHLTKLGTPEEMASVLKAYANTEDN